MSNSSSSWTDEEIEYVIITVLCVAVASLVLWCAFPSKKQENVQPIRANVQQNSSQRDLTTGDNINGQGTQHQRVDLHTRQNIEEDEDGILSILSKNRRLPPHQSCSSESAKNNIVLHDGILPFRFTCACNFETAGAFSNGGDTGKITDENSCRKDRARIFTKLFSPIRTKESGILKPPSRGSNVVVSVPEKDVACRKLRHGLFLLGTYYNLFVLLCLDDDEEKGIDRKIDASDSDVYKKERARVALLVSKIRGDSDKVENNFRYASSVPKEVLPSHRIVATNTSAGRVAFVRQFPKSPEFLLDFEEEVHKELTRFGFKVLLYSKSQQASTKQHSVSNNMISGIGHLLFD